MTGPNMETFGARQARRFKERKGYDRESMHLYRPGPETVGKWVTKLRQSAGPDGVVLVPERKRVTAPFAEWKTKARRWYLDLNANHRRRKSRQFEQTLLTWRQGQPRVRFGCYYERRAAGLV